MGKKNKKNQYHKQKKRVNHSKNSSPSYQGGVSVASKSIMSEMPAKELAEFANGFYKSFRVVENDFIKRGKIVYENTERIRYTIFAEKDGSAFKICPRIVDDDLLAEIGAVDVRVSTIHAEYPYDAGFNSNSGFDIEIQADFREDLSEDEVKERLSIIQKCLSVDATELYMRWSIIAINLSALLPSNLYHVTDTLNLSKDEKQYTVIATSQKILTMLGAFEEMKDFVKLYNSVFA